MINLAQDIRYTMRQLRRSPGFATTAVVTLALSVGATAAMVGVLRATLLNPLPYPRSGQLVAIGDRNLKGFESNGLVSVLRTSDLAGLQHERHRVFSSVGFYYADDSTIAIDEHTPAGVAAVGVSDSFFSTMGTAPMLGRTVTASDGLRGSPEVVVLSYRAWKTIFAADPRIVGRTVRLGTVQATVIGVMPEQFRFPAGTELWHHGHISAANFGGYRGEGSRFVQVVARLDDSETVASAKQQSALLSTQLAAAYPDSDAAWVFDLLTLRDSLFGDYRRALLLIAAAVGLVLLVATVNLAGLQLSRNAGRTQEFAVRCALGVTRARLVRQLLTESTLLVFTGSLAGVALAVVLLRSVVRLLPVELTRVERPHVDLWVLTFSCALALAVGLVTGIFPALLAARTDLSLSGTRSAIGRPKLLGRGFAAMQIALALVLLTLSAAVLRNLYGLLHTPLGYDAAEVQTFSVDLPWGFDPGKAHRIYQQVESRVSAMPGVASVGSVTALPLAGFSARRTFDIAGVVPTPHHDAIVAQARNLSPGYLHAMRTPLLAGRDFTAQDSDPNTPSVILINQTLANRYFAGRNPVGQRLITPIGAGGTDLLTSEIEGVVGDVRGTGGTLDGAVQPEVYFPENGGWPHMQFAVRTTLPTATLEPAIRRMITAIDASASVGHYATLASAVYRSLAQPRLNAGLLASFAALSLLLVVVGVYGLIAFDVSQRVRELGLRIALGSSRGKVFALLLGDAARVLAGGLVLGFGMSFIASRVLASAMPGDHASATLLSVATAVLLAAAVFAASLIPARRAASVEPMEALRNE